MHRRRIIPGLVLVLAMLLGSACAAEPDAPEASTEVAAGVVNALDQYLPTTMLPRLAIAYDPQGVPSIFGISTTTIQSLAGIDLSFLNLPSASIDRLAAQNLQHVEFEVADSGVFLYANGDALPYLTWDAASLAQLGALIDAVDLSDECPACAQTHPTIRRALPLLQRVGIDLVLLFPRAEGADAIPVRDRDQRALAVAAETEPTLVVQLGVDYAENGVPTILGVNTRDWQALGVNLSFLELDQDTLDMLVEHHALSNLGLELRSDGIIISANGARLPYLAFSEQHLNNAVRLYRRLYGSGWGTDFAAGAVPLISAIDIDVDLNLNVPAAE